MKRTHLPLNALRVLDAAARHLSFTRAADELAVTPAAVGQQIRALEDVLGVVLFRRTPRGLELTMEAEAGLEALRTGFLKFEEAVQAMQAGQASSALTIAAPRDFLSRWLAPRIAAFAATHPDIRWTLVAADVPIDFTEANLDCAIHWAADAGDLEGVALVDSDMVDIAPPDTHGQALSVISWPGALGEDASAMRVGDAGLAIDAVLAGLGRARVPRALVERELADGRLLADGNAEHGNRYWLVAPLPQWRQKKVKALVEALVASR